MLKTKEDIKAQKFKDGGDQLDLIGTIKSQKKQIKKQRFVSYSLLITIALSSLLWLFTGIKNSLKQGTGISITLPKLNLLLPKNSHNHSINTSVEDIISKSIAKQDGVWSFYIALYQPSNQQQVVYQSNIDQFSQDPQILKNNLQSLDKSTVDLLSAGLPDGLSPIENLIEGPQSLQSEILINLPSQKNMLILSKHTGSSDLSQSKNTLSLLIPQIYWNLIQID